MMEANDKREGPQTITTRLDFRGMIVGDVTVRAPGHLELRGTIIGNLRVERYASAVVRGRVSGIAYSEGGSLEVLGRAGGVGGDPSPIVHPGAVIGD